MPYNQCSGSHSADPDLKDLKRKHAGYWINPETNQKELVTYDNHKYCNQCKLCIPKLGHKFSSSLKCPCCGQKLRTRRHDTKSRWGRRTPDLKFPEATGQVKAATEMELINTT